MKRQSLLNVENTQKFPHKNGFSVLAMIADYLWVWALAADRVLKRQRTRVALRSLDDHQLRDVGISREASRREAAKWFWQD